MRSARIREPRAHFIAVWEFYVRSDKRRAFERAYGPSGDWVQLFRRAEGYIRTELFRDPNNPGRYITLDFWTTRLAFQKFKRRNIAAYNALDRKCESLTEHERRIGEFAKAVPRNVVFNRVSGQITIRDATPADLESMMAIERQTPSAAHWNENAYRELFEEDAPRRIALISENNCDSLNGFVIARYDPENCELENIVVADREQGQGIGYELAQRLKTRARALGCKQILLEVRESNRAARVLYEKSGFQISGRRRSYYQAPPEDAILYTLTL